MRNYQNINSIRNTPNAVYNKIHNWIAFIYRILVEFERLYLNATREALNRMNNNNELRISYILKDIDKLELQDKLIRKDKLRKKNTSLLHVYELLMAVGIDTYRLLDNEMLSWKQKIGVPTNNNNWLAPESSWSNATTITLDESNLMIKTICDKFIELEKIREYCNQQLQIISATYNHQVLQYSSRWKRELKKFTKKDITFTN